MRYRTSYKKIAYEFVKLWHIFLLFNQLTYKIHLKSFFKKIKFTRLESKLILAPFEKAQKNEHEKKHRLR